VLAFLIVLFVLGGINWYLVFSKGARRRWGGSAWSFLGREADDALSIAIALIIAVFCSSVIIGALIIALVTFFK
jgi:hypothetical protein